MNSLIIGTSNAKKLFRNYLRYDLKEPINIYGYVKLLTGWLYYNWRNVTNNIGNNKLLIIKNNVGVETIITIPDGSYSVQNLNDAIINFYELQTGYKIPYTIFTENHVYNRITFFIGEDIHIALSYGMAYMLGELDNTGSYDKSKIDNFSPAYTDIHVNLPYPPKIENVNSVKLRCNLVDNEYQYEEKILHSFIPNKSFGSLIFLEPKSDWKRTVNSQERYVDLWLTDQDGNPLEIEDDMEFTITIANENFIH